MSNFVGTSNGYPSIYSSDDNGKNGKRNRINSSSLYSSGISATSDIKVRHDITVMKWQSWLSLINYLFTYSAVSLRLNWSLACLKIELFWWTFSILVLCRWLESGRGNCWLNKIVVVRLKKCLGQTKTLWGLKGSFLVEIQSFDSNWVIDRCYTRKYFVWADIWTLNHFFEDEQDLRVLLYLNLWLGKKWKQWKKASLWSQTSRSILRNKANSENNLIFLFK